MFVMCCKYISSCFFKETFFQYFRRVWKSLFGLSCCFFEKLLHRYISLANLMTFQFRIFLRPKPQGSLKLYNLRFQWVLIITWSYFSKCQWHWPNSFNEICFKCHHKINICSGCESKLVNNHWIKLCFLQLQRMWSSLNTVSQNLFLIIY
jgi:hypothetical protein